MPIRTGKAGAERRQSPTQLLAEGNLAGAIAALRDVDRDELRREGEQVANAVASWQGLPHLVEFAQVLLTLEDDQRAYGALREATRLLFGVSEAASDSEWPQVMAGMAEMLLAYLEERPAEPLLLNSLAVALYELNEPKVAKTLLKRVLTLAPDTPEAENNLQGVNLRLQHPLRAQLPPMVSVKLRGLVKRAEAVAARAQPAQGQTISFCMIVKNEEQDLPDCLASVKDIVDQMIVVDTGSTDRTVEIAESFGAEVISFPWTGSFSDARNISLEAATCNWVFYLDADERLVAEDGERLRALVGQTWREGFYLHETNFTGTEDSGGAQPHMAFRLFKNRRWYRFMGAIHEQKMWAFPTELPERFLSTDVRILHYGYLKERRLGKDKINRNIGLLLQELAEAPSAFTHFNLGSEYSWLSEYPKAREQYEQSLTLIQQWAHWRDVKVCQFAPMLVVRLAEAIRMTDRPELYAFVDQGLDWFPDHTDLLFERALGEFEEERLEDAEATLKRCLEIGDAPVEWGPISGRGTFLAMRLLAMIYERQGRTDEALTVLERSAEEHPQFTPVLFELSKLLLAKVGAEKAEQRLRELGADQSASAAMWVGNAFYEESENAHAEKWYRIALERSPQHPPSILGLGETLLTLGRYEEAVEALADFDESHLLVGAALRSRCFCLLCLGRLDETEQLLPAYAEQHPEEAAVYHAWLMLARDQEAPSLGPESLRFLVRIYEALIKLHEFDQFERLLPLLAGVVTDPATRHRLLAGLYERQGFDELAMAEWQALYDPQAIELDVLYGVARAATRLGHLDDARQLLEAAVTVDPTHAPSRRLLEAIETTK